MNTIILLSSSRRLKRLSVNVRYNSAKPSREIAKTYDPEIVEQGWYEWWESQGFFQASSSVKPLGKINMILPPPNVTGKLHIGHALTLSIQDALVRWYRMNEYQVSWRPGIDHAGIATQTVVEKSLESRGINRIEMGRDKFIEQVWKWKTEYGNVITDQIRKIGASLDWKNEFFTFDEQRSKAVNTCFINLFDQGLIYRGNRMVNWSCKLGTAISDIEVEYEEVTESKMVSIEGGATNIEVGVLHFIDYPLLHTIPGLETITVATTRPETIFGDRAIAIHPDNPVARQLVKNKACHPLIPGLHLPIIADAEFVDSQLGTGALKITPAHDSDDYEFAKRHNIDIVAVFDENGKMLKSCGIRELEGIDRLNARAKVCNLLYEKGLYTGKTNHPMRLARCSRSGDIIEPMLRPQWFLRTTPMAEGVLDDLKRQVPHFTPPFSSKIWEQWLKNVQDWCISRQLWWGHKIPAWNIRGTEQWVAAQTEEEAIRKTGGLAVLQDEDVLDTWFSSALLPLSAFGWDGKQTPLEYPLDIMESGSDILFFWLARMSLLGTHITGQSPFKEVLLHPMVCDSQGQKMSKSLGNVIDPLHVINGVSREQLEVEVHKSNLPKSEIEHSVKYIAHKFPKGISPLGTDALRFALVDYTIQSGKICLDESNVKAAKALISKLWNAFLFLQAYHHKAAAAGLNPAQFKCNTQLRLHDMYILKKLSETVKVCVDAFEKRTLYEATIKLRTFVINNLCSIYLEFIKQGMWNLSIDANSSSKLESLKSLETLNTCLEVCLKLLHPLMPFVTELWQHIKSDVNSPTIMLTRYPQVDSFSQHISDKSVMLMTFVIDVIASFRVLREKHQIPKASNSIGFIQVRADAEDKLISTLTEYKKEIARQTGIGKIKVVFCVCHFHAFTDYQDDHSHYDQMVTNVISPSLSVHLFHSKDTKAINSVQIEHLQKELNLVKTRLKLPKYIEKAPAQVQEKDKKRLQVLEQLLAHYLNQRSEQQS